MLDDAARARTGYDSSRGTRSVPKAHGTRGVRSRGAPPRRALRWTGRSPRRPGNESRGSAYADGRFRRTPANLTRVQLTERVGFEPTVPVSRYTRFPVAPIRPLWHLSSPATPNSSAPRRQTPPRNERPPRAAHGTRGIRPRGAPPRLAFQRSGRSPHLHGNESRSSRAADGSVPPNPNHPHASASNGEGGIRTHETLLGPTRFRVVRLQPDSATSPGRGGLPRAPTPRNYAALRLSAQRPLLSRKKARNLSAAASARTPPTTSILWFTRGNARRSTTDPAAPPFGSAAP